MKTQSNAKKALAVLAASTFLAACGNGTSKSSSDGAGAAGGSNIQQEPTVSLSPIEITHENYTQLTSQSLKSLLLNDAGTNALNRSANVTGSHRQDLSGVATGVVLKLHPYPCVGGGEVAFTADIRDANGGMQIDFNNPVRVDFSTNFNNCSQAGNLVDGKVVLTMDGNLSKWLNGTSYSFNSHVSTNGLFVQQLGLPSFNLEGEFGYNVSSTDGTTVVTEVISSNSLYAADMSYQMIDFYVEKTVDTTTKAYSYQVRSEFSDFYSVGNKVTYETVEPLTGVGFALPSGGVIAINGADNGNVMVYVEESENLRLELHLDDDGEAEDVYHTNWHDLVLRAFDSVQM